MSMLREFRRQALVGALPALLLASAAPMALPSAASPGSPALAATAPVATLSAPTSGPVIEPRHVDNPYLGVAGYINPEWRAKAESVPGGARVSSTPTGVWVDRIASIDGGPAAAGAMGLRAHLDAAVAQGAGYIQVVVNDLPHRNCGRTASIGEFSDDELSRYQADFIDPIAKIEADPAYANLRIVNVLEIGSLPYLVSGLGSGGFRECRSVAENGAYIKGIQYALNRLHAVGPNVYLYLDGSEHGWLGWRDNFEAATRLFAMVAKGASGGLAAVDGFITNAGGYAPLTEPYFTIETTISGKSVREAKWVDWADFVDELTYAQQLRTKLVSLGFSSTIGMLIDTSRNGWGGRDRPSQRSSSTNIDTFVDESRIDRRYHMGNWCNQAGAGLGERPAVSPRPGIDAYVWMKPPGESDGASASRPDSLEFDKMCDPAYTGNPFNAYHKSGASPNAPAFGQWFPAQFAELMANAYPRL